VSRPPSRHRRAPVVGRCASAAGNAVGEGVASGARRTSRVAGAIGEDDTAEIHEEREASRASRVCLRPEPDRVRDVELFGADDGLGWRRRAIPQGGSFRCDRTIPTMGIPRRFRAVSPRHLSVWRAATSPRSPACCPLVIASILGERRTARGPYRLSNPSIPVSIRSIRNDRGWRIRSVHVGPSPSRTFHSNNFNTIESVNIRDNAGSLSISDLTACEYLRFRSSKVEIYTRSTIDHLFMWKINSLV
jgi:hypothetical protein